MNVANALEAAFSLEEQQSIESIPTDSPEAYEFYLRAVSLGGGTQVLDAAIEYLDSAIRLDPNFALAYAAKAWLSAAVLTGNVPAQQAEYERIAQENATQALALDPTLGLAHFALAFVHQAHWRWDEAELAFEEALRLNPNNAEVLSQYSRTKRYRGEYDEAVEIARRAADLDPQNWGSYFFLGITYQYTRNYDAAATSFRRALELNPTVGNLHAQLGFSQVALGDWDDAARELKVAEEIYGENIQSQRYSQLAAGYAQMGRRDDVERLFHALEVRAENSPVTAAVWAQIYIALEEYDQALEWLEAAVDSQAPDLVPLGQIKGNPYGNPALDEPRFQELRDRIGI
jgi:tetratricopeptide (TPR) repeat protein